MAARKSSPGPVSDTLLVEVLTEELPPKALQSLGEVFKDRLLNGLIQYQLKLRVPAGARYFATPRRLAACIPDVIAEAPDRETEVTGPPANAPAHAVAGFANKHGVALDRLERRVTPKGEILVARLKIKGAVLDKVLPHIVEEALKALPVPKLMRWGSGEARFVRPVQGLMMLHGPRVIAGEVLGVHSSNATLGHRFLAGGPIRLKRADDYERALKDAGKVIVDLVARRTEIARQLEIAAGDASLVISDALLDEITALVEAPAAYAGAFDPGFLAVPEECLVLSMQQHQRYVPLRDRATGKLLPRFLFVSNIETKQPREIVHGNERVLRARLADAKFFFDQDRKTRLEARVPRLASVVYHGKLGNQLERVERIQLLAGKIAREIGADPLLAERAAWLAKADLLTEMVGEFPELQGVMGRYYAAQDGEPKEAADAIEAHYRPRHAGDVLPDGKIACAVALADKLDALAGFFGVGQVPTGDKDPFGLRRAALGVIRILVERDLPLSLNELVDSAFSGFNRKISDRHTDLATYVYERLSGYLKDHGYSALEVESVVSKNPDRINLVMRQLEAVSAFNSLPEAQSLAAANKRVVNILRQAEAKGESFTGAEMDKLREPAERALFEALSSASRTATPLFKQGNYTDYLKTFAVLKTPVDAFFDSVMVMVEDRELRQNRLALLADLREQMNRVADISKLAA